MSDDRSLSISSAVELQLQMEQTRSERELDRLLTELNRALSTPPETVMEQVARRIIADGMRAGTIHKSEYGD